MNRLIKSAQFSILFFSLQAAVSADMIPAPAQIVSSSNPVSAVAPISSGGDGLTEQDNTLEVYGTGGFDRAVSALTIQPDGRIVAAGNFTLYGGVPVGRGIARLDSNANLEKTFTKNSLLIFEKAEMYALAVQPNGKILVGGNFKVHGAAHEDWQGLARLEADGRLDTSFVNVMGKGFESVVLAIALQSDGKILVGGNFTTYGASPLGGVARLEPDGRLDNDFTSRMGSGIDDKSTIKAISLQSDGKIIVVGDFSSFSGKKVDGIVRLNSDGSLDEEFYQNVGKSFFVGFPLLGGDEEGEEEVGLYLATALIQPDGHIVLGGEFISYNKDADLYSSRILRLDSAGNLDLDFIKNTLTHKFEKDVTSLLYQPDGKIVVGCNTPFSRLNPDGTHDADFLMMAGYAFSGDVNSMAAEPDGKIIVGGRFNSYKGIKVGNIMRLNQDGTMDEHFVSGSYK